MALNIATLSPAERLELLQALKAEESAARTAAKAARAETRDFVGRLVRIVSDKFPETTFSSGAVGYSLGGKNVDVTLADGSVRSARVSMLVRWEDSIPATEDK